MPIDTSKTFMQNLSNSFPSEAEMRGKIYKIDVKCSTHFLNEAFYNLHKMNITRMSLFPGLDGFGKYLKHLIPLPTLFLAKDYDAFP